VRSIIPATGILGQIMQALIRSIPIAVLAAIIATSTFAQGQAHATVYVNGKAQGSAVITMSLGPNGQLSEKISVISTAQGGSVTMQSVFSKNGMPILMTAHFGSKMISGDIKIDFGQNSAKLTAHTGSQSKTQNLKYPSGSSLNDLSNFWFVRDHPKPGAKCYYTEFDLQRMSWKALTDTYVGDVTLTYHGKKVTAHKVQNADGTQLLDDHGIPYRIESSDKSVIVRD